MATQKRLRNTDRSSLQRECLNITVPPRCVPQPLSLERGRGRAKRRIVFACRLVVVITIPEDSLIGGETFPTTIGSVGVGSRSTI